MIQANLDQRSSILAKKFRRILLSLCLLSFPITGCLLEPKIAPKPVAMVLNAVHLHQKDVETWPLPVDSLTTCRLDEARNALSQARMARLFHSSKAAGYYRDALVHTLYALNASEMCGGCKDHSSESISLHNESLKGLLLTTGFGVGQDAAVGSEKLAALGFQMSSANGFIDEFEPDELWLAHDFMTVNVKDPAREKGLGLPLIVYRKPRPRLHIEPEMFYPPHWKFAATAVARLANSENGEGFVPVIELVDPLESDHVVMGQTTIPLAKDLTTPVISLLSHSGYRDKARQGLFRPNELTDEEGVTLVHPYRSGRIPLVLIHGMGCSPRIMADIVNSVHADPELRQRYQVMVVYYTTGDTILQDSGVIRRAFNAMRSHYDPSHTDLAWDKTVVLGHSLGGPIARLLTSHSDHQMEQLLFTKPWNELVMSDEVRQASEPVLFFEPVTEISRVIYLAATMRGSRIADHFEARFLSSVLPRRKMLERFHSEIIANNGIEAFQPVYRDRVPSSIDNQSPESPMLAVTNQLRLKEGLISHSIQANATPLLPQQKSTDGLVPFTSSLIDEAVSQVILPLQDHFCTHDRRTLNEISRILKENLGE